MRLKRWFVESGIHPILGILIAIILFIIGSKYLFLKTELAKWVFPLIALSFIVKLGGKDKANQLKVIFDKRHYLILRLIENILISIPFLIYLVYEDEYLLTLALVLLSILFAFDPFNIAFNKTIPTPFKKWPFENSVGFRKSILVVLIAYFVLIKAIQVNNYNLGIASYGFLFSVMMSFNIKPEKSIFVWIFSDTSNRFLYKKVSNAFIGTTILTLPMIVSLFLYFPEHLLISLVVGLIGYLYLLSIILAKYSAFPKEMNIPQAILFALSIWFPPMLLIVIPIFYKRSKQNLDFILQ